MFCFLLCIPPSKCCKPANFVFILQVSRRLLPVLRGCLLLRYVLSVAYMFRRGRHVQNVSSVRMCANPSGGWQRCQTLTRERAHGRKIRHSMQRQHDMITLQAAPDVSGWSLTRYFVNRCQDNKKQHRTLRARCPPSHPLAFLFLSLIWK